MSKTKLQHAREGQTASFQDRLYVYVIISIQKHVYYKKYRPTTSFFP
jgi:hypothetical protein